MLRQRGGQMGGIRWEGSVGGRWGGRGSRGSVGGRWGGWGSRGSVGGSVGGSWQVEAWQALWLEGGRRLGRQHCSRGGGAWLYGGR